MIPHPVRRGTLYAPSDTRTAQNFSLARYQKLSPAPQSDPASNQFARLFTLGSQTKLARIRTLEKDWDGYGSAKPVSEAVANAEARLPELYRLSTIQGVWREPHISASEAGEISFEWWSGPRKVTMYFGDDAVEIIKVWGVNMDTEMDLQQMLTLDSFPAVWAWLYGN